MVRGTKTFKREKYEELIKNEINLLLRQEFNDPRLQFVSVTKVELSVDKTQAKVYWDTFDSSLKGQVSKALRNAPARLRSLLAGRLKVRQVPEIILSYDSQFEDEKVITELLQEEARAGKTFL